VWTAAAFAQENSDRAKTEGLIPDRRLERQARRQRTREHRLLRLRKQLELSDVQRQQLRELRQARLESTKSTREELLSLREKLRAGTFTEADKARVQQLRRELGESRKGMRSDIQNVLTPEQHMKIEEFKKARQERRKRIREFRRSL